MIHGEKIGKMETVKYVSEQTFVMPNGVNVTFEVGCESFQFARWCGVCQKIVIAKGILGACFCPECTTEWNAKIEGQAVPV